MAYEILIALAGAVVGAVAYHLRNQKLVLEHRLLQERLELQQRHHAEAAEKLELRLRELSGQMLQEKGRIFREDSLRGMELILTPFREKMTEFSRRIEEMHLSETRERVKLQAEIERIALTGQKMSLETENLTRALKGDVKLQGNWGELMLERILEASGLRSGEEFTLQGKDLGLKNAEGRHQMPDVVINLPEGRHLVIDSKVSLVAYERFVNTSDPLELQRFLDSVNAHVRDLAGKEYHLLEKLESPDYVMLFVPIEGAFALAMQQDQELFLKAWEKNIVLVSPSTLLATLRTVASVWKQERQTRNALEIARQAGNLYDKFVGVAQDLDLLSSQFRKTSDALESLKGKMFTGKGNIAGRMENLRQLGARTSKRLELEETPCE